MWLLKTMAMKRNKMIIKILAITFKWLFIADIAFTILCVGFETANIVNPQFKWGHTSVDLGKFRMIKPYGSKTTMIVAATEKTTKEVSPNVYVITRNRVRHILNPDMTLYGYPTIKVENTGYKILVLIFVILGISLSLITVYQLKCIFQALANAEDEQPFSKILPSRFRLLGKIYIVYFVIGIIFPIVVNKIVYSIEFEGVLFEPVLFDTSVLPLNKLWIAIFLFIIAEVFEAGFRLKQENDLTI